MIIDSALVNQVLSNILPAIKQHQSQRRAKAEDGKRLRPFIFGVSGLQGSGKSTWAESIVHVLTEEHKLNTITLSLDDLYHNHDNLVRVRNIDTKNGLLRTRGQPGTHDEVLAGRFFASLAGEDEEIALPAFDKSRFDGEGDRAPEKEWKRVKTEWPDVLVFEGWCLGFQPLEEEQVEAKWEAARKRTGSKEDETFSTNTLALHSLEHLQAVNANLRRYCETFMGPDAFDSFVHLDTDDLVNVYRWRMEQEAKLRQVKGTGMTDEQVVRFVKGYMPAYELYLERLQRQPFFGRSSVKKHVRVVLGRDRSVSQVEVV